MSDRMTLGALLRSDLERYFHYYGQPGRVPRRRDLWRSFLLPRCLPITLYRLARAAQSSGHSGIAKFLTWMNFYLHNIEISAKCEIGSHLFMPHVAGTVIGAHSIGDHAVIYHQVTIGAKSIEYEHVGRPCIGDYAFIASGARIIGELTLGDRCTVGANAVVMRSFGSNLLLTGIPATPHPRDGEPEPAPRRKERSARTRVKD